MKALLYKICGRMYAQTRFVRRGSKDGLIDRILRFVDENYQRDCSLQELSAQLSYDYYYLSKFFIRNTGISYHDFVNEYRVSSACNLLVDAERPIKDIARQCGFDSLRSFNRVFRQRRRITPSQYRESSPTIFIWRCSDEPSGGAGRVRCGLWRGKGLGARLCNKLIFHQPADRLPQALDRFDLQHTSAAPFLRQLNMPANRTRLSPVPGGFFRPLRHGCGNVKSCLRGRG